MASIGGLYWEARIDGDKQVARNLKKLNAEFHAAKRVYLDMRTPMEEFNEDFSNLGKLAAKMPNLVESFARKSAQMAVGNKEAERALLAEAASLRKLASDIERAEKATIGFNDETHKEVAQLYQAADALERNLQERRRANAEIEREKRAKEVAARQARVYNDMIRGVREMVKSSRGPQQEYIDKLRMLRIAFRDAKISGEEFHRTAAKLRTDFQKQTGSGGRGFLGGMVSRTGLGMYAGAGLAGGAGMLAGGAIMKGMELTGEAISAGADVGRLRVEFGILLGDMQRGAGLMQSVRDFAAETPVTFNAALQSTRQLLQGQGMNADNVLLTLRQLSDVAAGDTERLQRLALAFRQVSDQGRLMGQEARQFAESGLSVLAYVAKDLGISMNQAKQMMEDGAVSFDMVRKALESATSEGGKFNNMLETVGETTPYGQMVIFRGELEKLSADLGEVAAEWVAGPFSQAGTNFIRAQRDAFSTIGNSISSAVQWTSTFVSVLGGAEYEAHGAAVSAEQIAKYMEEAAEESHTLFENLARSGIAISEGEENAKSLIQSLRDQNLELQKGKDYVEDLKLAQEGATAAQMEEIRLLREKNAELERQKKIEEELKDLRERKMDNFEWFRDEVDKAKSDAKAKPIKIEAAPTISKGSREEYKLLAEMRNSRVTQAARQHAEAMAVRKKIAELLEKLNEKNREAEEKFRENVEAV